jgi:spermidine synthase
MPSMMIPQSKFKLKVVAEVISPLNGILLVTTNPLLGTNIITPEKTVESGVFLEKVWEQSLKNIQKGLDVKKCLILGFGGGSAAKAVLQLWPNAKITGVEFDHLMIELGKKYLDMPENSVEIIVDDAYSYINYHTSKNLLYSLILVDLFIGGDVPSKFENADFVKKLDILLAYNGFVVFNRINTKEKKRNIAFFKSKVLQIFKNIGNFHYKNNLFIICPKNR